MYKNVVKVTISETEYFVFKKPSASIVWKLQEAQQALADINVGRLEKGLSELNTNSEVIQIMDEMVKDLYIAGRVINDSEELVDLSKEDFKTYYGDIGTIINCSTEIMGSLEGLGADKSEAKSDPEK